jgi:hypothetical protein
LGTVTGLLTACGPGGARGSGTDSAPLAYVASGGNNHVRVIDLESGETLRRIYTGAGPWRLVPSPDRSRLWIQHWYAGTTAVLELEHHEVVEVLPFRGPGSFSEDGSAFLTFDWPGRDLARIEGVDTRSPTVVGESTTRIKQAYDLAPFREWRSTWAAEGEPPERLFVAQYDPIARGPVPRYGGVAILDPRAEEDTGAAPEPETVDTGVSPLRVVPIPGQPFVLTADSGTNGITLINQLGDRRALATCDAPREILLAPDLSRMVVLCWHDIGRHASRAVSFRSDFTARPWPSLEREAEADVPGGLVGGAFHPSGDRVYAVDRPGGRLIELGLPDLGVRREIPTGDEPQDVEVVAVSNEARSRLRSGESEGRKLLREILALARGGAASDGADGRAGFRDLAWTETTSWLEEPEEESAEDGAEPVMHSRTVRLALLAPDALRTEISGGGVRISRDGVSVSLDAAGRFWVTPRQDLASVVYSLPNLTVDEAIHHLAGDVPGSRFLRGGLAVDLVSEVREGGRRFYVIGTSPEATGAPGGEETEVVTSQLWIDAETGLPTNLIEQFPVFEAGGHATGAAPRAAETKLYEFEPVGADGPLMPRRLERVVEGDWLQHVQLTDFEVDQGLDEDLFDPARLGGFEPVAGEPFREGGIDAFTTEPETPSGSDPGRALLVHHPAEPVASPLAPHTPYLTSPPTSGPYLPFTADWGVHRVPLPLPLQVHNLLDGGVALQYNCPEGCPALVARLEELAGRNDFLVVAPYPWMDARLAATAWGRIATFDERDLAGSGWVAEVERFIDAYAGVGHHEDNMAPHGSAPSGSPMPSH